MALDPLASILSARPQGAYRLQGIQRAAGWLSLGQTSISTELPVWRFDEQGWLADSARYYARPMAPCDVFPTGALLVFFRQFDRSVTEDQPSDYYAGWVPAAEEDSALSMVVKMNRHLDRALTWKVLDKNDSTQCPACSDGLMEPGLDVRREPEGERYHLRGTLLCNACGQTAGFDAPLHYLLDPDQPGTPLMRD